MGPGTFCWNELNTLHAPEAEIFYTKLFGWETDRYSQTGMDCTLFKIAPHRVGGLVQNPTPDIPSQWLSYVRVASVADSLAKAVALQAQILIPPTDIPNVGRIAVFRDPQGAALGLFEPETAPR